MLILTQETVEFGMKKPKESVSFNVSLQLRKTWMMEHTSLEVYNTIYNITPTINKHKVLLIDQHSKELGIDTESVMKVENFYRTYKIEADKEYTKIVGRANALIPDTCFKKRNSLIIFSPNKESASEA